MEKSDRIYIAPKRGRPVWRHESMDPIPIKWRLRAISIALLVSAAMWFGAWQIMKALR